MPDPNPPNYDELERRFYQQYAREFSNDLAGNNVYARQKVMTFCENFGYEYMDVEQKIYDDPMFRAHFAKKPNRTGMHERVAGEYLAQFSEITEFTILPKTGQNSIFLTENGDFRLRPELNNISTKSLDFKWQVGNTLCYASHKFTKTGGGHQDNQLDDVNRLLERFRNRHNNHMALFAICDGGFFEDELMTQLRDNTRTNPPLSFACHIGEVIGIIRDHFIE